MVTAFLFFFVSLLIFCTTESLLVNITILQSAVAKGAVCLDGTPPAYHLDRGSGTGLKNWVISLEGGGWCENVTHCLQRKNTHLGSSAKMGKQSAFSAMMSNDRKYNPEFYNWNRVSVRYCDGGSFTGDVEAVDPGTGLHYRGARIYKAIMEELLAQGMNTAQNAILSGCSAGGLATILHCDNFRALLPKSAKVKCFSDAGYFVDLFVYVPSKDIRGKAYIEQYFNDIVTLHGSAKNLPPSCTSKLKPSLCFFPQNVAQQIQTPLFIINAAYDHWQVRNSLVAPGADPKGSWTSCKADIKNCTSSQLKVLQVFRDEFLKTLEGLGPSSTRGYYINSCFSHCQTQQQAYWFGPNSPRLFNKTIAEAVQDWFLDRNLFRQIDCPYPCDKTCVEEPTYIISSEDT